MALDVRWRRVTGEIVDSAMRVHTALGPGLLEKAYEICLAHELRERGLDVSCQLALPISYRGIRLDVGYRVDLLVEGAVVVEIKAVSKLLPVHKAQVLSYLKLNGFPLGLLFNFHEARLRNAIVRIAN